jgi:Phage derived protein Gp49-like (DUF891)
MSNLLIGAPLLANTRGRSPVLHFLIALLFPPLDRIARTLFIVVENEIILHHGFIKKTQQTPKQELDLARKRQRQYRHAQD